MWDNIEKIIGKVQSIEKKSSGNGAVRSKENCDYNPTSITVINKNILDIADRLEIINQRMKVRNSTDTKKPEKADVVSPTISKPPEPELFESYLEDVEVGSTPEISSDDNQPEPDNFNRRPESLSAQITNLYNRGINEKSERDLFWETFSITRIGNANAVALRKGEVSAPDFREADNGDFLAIKNENQNYFVVPLFDTMITTSAFNEGGINYAFECFGYDSQSARSIVKVNKAAVFRCDGGQWVLVDDGKGELVLQN